MASAKKYYPYPRRKSHIQQPSSKMLTLFFISWAPLVQPFVMPRPAQTFLSTQQQHHASSTCCATAAIISLDYPSSPIPNRKIIRRTNNIHRSRRLSSTVQLFAKSDDDGEDDNSNDDDKSNENKMPSDDALFGDSIGDELTLSDSNIIYGEDDDDDDDDDDDIDPYAQSAPSEFTENGDTDDDKPPPSSSSLFTSLARQSRELNTTPLDWGGALSTLRSRVSDIESGTSTNPSTALFRTISRERPNEAIGRFVREANPEVVAAMTGAVSSLLGSLSNPAMGVETIVQASSEKLGNLCFQLQMTGYMFRNAEYVLALKSLMNIDGDDTNGSSTLEQYRSAFQRIDTDGSGYLERDEIEAMLADVYEGQPPAFEVSTFLEFFDSNNDGRVSWEEFEEGFGVVTRMASGGGMGGGEKDVAEKMTGFSLPGSFDDDDDDDDVEDLFGEPSVSGTIQVELEDGKIIEVDAQEYMNDLKQEALALKRELAQEKGIDPKEMGIPENNNNGKDAAAFVKQAVPGPDSSGGIASYIASLQGDVKSLTQGISPEVVDSMKMLIEFVLEGGPEGGGGGGGTTDKKKEMELPGSALQQLALWQLVIGYRLRETEATGEWRKMLE
ncbi:hypothetical protein ACHAXR_007060 [Thalassiosira sp. AJA248-18]